VISRGCGRVYRSVHRAAACVVLACASASGAVAVAHAQASPAIVSHVAAGLIAETRNVVPGRPLQVALRQKIESGWHTYWSNPGESGLPTTIDWSLPSDFRAGPIVWPTPERFTVGPVVGYGYKGEVLLPITIDVPNGLQPGSDVTISAHASWLVCSDICIPEEADFSLSFPVGSAPEPDLDAAQAFATARTRTPTPNPFPTVATHSKDDIILRVATGDATRLRNIAFFPADADVIDDGAPPSIVADSEGIVLRLKRDAAKPPAAALNGILRFDDQAAQADGAPGAIAIAVRISAAAPDFDAGLGLMAVLLLALAGGIILNLMPCVLPVLSIKVLALVQHSQSSPGEVRLQGAAYAVGVLVTFAIIAGALIGLRAVGAEIGWGFQLQSPVFIALMVYLLFAVGLNLSGVFAVDFRLGGIGSEAASQGGYAGSFFTGALATLVATPCTAPFMAAAVGYAVTQPWYVALAVLETVGLGLALPFLIVAFSPRARRLLPKPGSWMVRLKEILAFPLYGTAVWLMYVLTQQTGALGATAVLAGLVLIALAAWLYNAVCLSEGPSRRWGVGIAAVAAAAAFALTFLVDDGGASQASPSKAIAGGVDWQPFSQARLDALRAEGRPVFIDFTAAWCITCQVNERIALADRAVVKAFADRGIAALRADWTRQDAGITRILEANGRAGVPLYLYYPTPTATGQSKPPIILPQLLTATSVLHELSED
jgi:thiol:disulfide interchange protein